MRQDGGSRLCCRWLQSHSVSLHNTGYGCLPKVDHGKKAITVSETESDNIFQQIQSYIESNSCLMKFVLKAPNIIKEAAKHP